MAKAKVTGVRLAGVKMTKAGGLTVVEHTAEAMAQDGLAQSGLAQRFDWKG
jgi:hypothetical protein